MFEKFQRKVLVTRQKTSSPMVMISPNNGYGYVNAAATETFFKDVRWVEIMFDREKQRLVFYPVVEQTKDSLTVSRSPKRSQSIIFMKTVMKVFGLWELCTKWDVWRWTLKPSGDGLCEINFNLEGTTGVEP